MNKASSKIEIVFFKDNGESYLKAYLLKLLFGYTPFSTDRQDASFEDVSVNADHYALSDLKELINKKFSNNPLNNEAQLKQVIDQLDYVLLHESPKKYHVANQALQIVFSGQRSNLSSLLNQSNFDAVQFYSYYCSVKNEVSQKLKESMLKFYPHQNLMLGKVNSRHHIGEKMIREFMKLYPHRDFLLAFSDKTISTQNGLIMTSEPIELAKLPKDRSLQSQFDELWQHYLKKVYVPVQSMALAA